MCALCLVGELLGVLDDEANLAGLVDKDVLEMLPAEAAVPLQSQGRAVRESKQRSALHSVLVDVTDGQSSAEVESERESGRDGEKNRKAVGADFLAMWV